MEFPEGVGAQALNPSMGGVWIFFGTSHCHFYCYSSFEMNSLTRVNPQLASSKLKS